MQFGFERLQVWQKSRQLIVQVYQIIEQLPKEERYGLSDQLRRASISIASNLAEGGGRLSQKEKIHFCEIAYGSLMEVTCQIILAQDLGFITEEQGQNVRMLLEEQERLIRGYHNYLKEELKRLS